MAAKDVRNLIITLIILAVGIKLIVLISQTYTKTAASAADLTGVANFTGIVDAINSLSDLIVLGLGILIIILIPVYLSKRSNERKLMTVPSVRGK
jgi:hypothetical protein